MKNNSNTQRDIHMPDEDPRSVGTEIVKPEELLNALDTLQNAIDRDTPVTREMIHDARCALQNVTVRMGDREMSLEELGEDTEMRINIAIWQQILNGDYRNAPRMTLLNDAVTKALAAHEDDIVLQVKKITNEQAKILAGSDAYEITMADLATITDEQADAFSEFEGDTLLLGVTHITDHQAESLAKCKVDRLTLDVTQLTDEQTKTLATADKKSLILRSLSHITDTQAKIWSEFAGRLTLGDLRNMTEKQAELLAARKNLTLWITELTDEQAKGLAHFKAGGKLEMELLHKISKKGAEYLAPLISSISCPRNILDQLVHAASASRPEQS